MIVPPGFSRPARSASSIILTAMRSLIELPGLNVSSLASNGRLHEALRDRVDADHRRVADGVENGVADLRHELSLYWRRPRTPGPSAANAATPPFSSSSPRSSACPGWRCSAPATASRPTTCPSSCPTARSGRWSSDFSEPDGFFRSDNFISNETTFQEVIPELKKRVSPAACISASGPIRTSPTSRRSSRAWRSSSTSAGRTCCDT